MDTTVRQQQEEGTPQVVRRRSDYKCLAEGLALVARRFKALLFTSWPLACLVLLVAVACGFVERAAEVSFFSSLTGGRQGQWVVLTLSVVSLLVQAMFLGCMAWQQRALHEVGELPRVRLRKVWRDVLPVFGRALLVLCVGLVVFALVVVLLGLALHPVMTSAGGSALGVSAMTVLSLCVAVVLTGVLSQVYFEHAVGGAGLLGALRSLSWSCRYVGRGLMVAFISMLLSAVVVLILSLPAFVCVYVDSSVVAARLEGDYADLPGYYPLVLFLSWLLSGVGSLLSMLIVSFPLFLNWGALRAMEQERLSQAG